MIVGVDRSCRVQVPMNKDGGPIGDHLIDVHVGLGAAARLPDRKRKFPVMLAGKNLIAGPNYQVPDLDGQLALLVIDLGTGPLQPDQAVDQGQGHSLLANAEVAEAAFSLCAPEPLDRNLDLTHGVVFDPLLHPLSLPCRGWRYQHIPHSIKTGPGGKDKSFFAAMPCNRRVFPLSNRVTFSPEKPVASGRELGITKRQRDSPACTSACIVAGCVPFSSRIP